MYYTLEDFLETDNLEMLSVISRARELTKAYYLTDYGDELKRNQILSELFGGIGKNVAIDIPFHCDYGKNIFLGDDVIINMNCTFVDNKPIKIGNHVLIASNVQIYTAAHPVLPQERLVSNWKELDTTFFRTYARPVEIEDNVWIGGGCIILAGVTIGKNSVIGAGSVVTHSIPANCVAVGNPCKVIRSFDNEITPEYQTKSMENNKWVQWAIELQSLAQAGLTYGKDIYDKERYTRIREISAEIMSQISDVSLDKVKDLFCNESGYQTPKVDTRAVIFKDRKILLVHENNGTWSLPGGWCDVDQSVASNVIKESKEETGLDVSAERLIAVQDWRLHNVQNYAYGVVKIFVLCKVVGGSFTENIETTEIGYFSRDELPANLATEKTTAQQIQMCFNAYFEDNWKTQFD